MLMKCDTQWYIWVVQYSWKYYFTLKRKHEAEYWLWVIETYKMSRLQSRDASEVTAVVSVWISDLFKWSSATVPDNNAVPTFSFRTFFLMQRWKNRQVHFTPADKDTRANKNRNNGFRFKVWEHCFHSEFTLKVQFTQSSCHGFENWCHHLNRLEVNVF